LLQSYSPDIISTALTFEDDKGHLLWPWPSWPLTSWPQGDKLQMSCWTMILCTKFELSVFCVRYIGGQTDGQANDRRTKVKVFFQSFCPIMGRCKFATFCVRLCLMKFSVILLGFGHFYSDIWQLTDRKMDRGGQCVIPPMTGSCFVAKSLLNTRWVFLIIRPAFNRRRITLVAKIVDTPCDAINFLNYYWIRKIWLSYYLFMWLKICLVFSQSINESLLLSGSMAHRKLNTHKRKYGKI